MNAATSCGQARRRRVRRAVLALVSVASLTITAACVGGGADSQRGAPEPDDVQPAGEGEQVTLQVWFGREDFMPDDNFESFHEEHPNITVDADVIPLEQASADYIRQFEADNAPDIVQVEFTEAGLLSRRGMLLDISQILTTWEDEAPGLYNNLADATWDMASWEGTPHGMALHYGPYWYVYRPDVLEELGAETPTTWDEVLDVGRQVRDQTDMHGYVLRGSRDELPVWAIGVFAQMGGQWEDGVMQIDSTAGESWLEFYQDLMADEIAHPDTVAWNSGDFRAAFIGDEGAQATIGLNIFPEIQNSLEYGTEWAVNPSPIAREGAAEQARYVANGWPYYVSAQTEYPYETGLVLRYLAEFEQALSVAKRYQPVSNTEVMGSEEYLAEHPYATDILDAWEQLEPQPFHLNQSAMYEIVQDAMQWALQNPDGDASEAAQRFQQELDELAEEVEEDQ